MRLVLNTLSSETFLQVTNEGSLNIQLYQQLGNYMPRQREQAMLPPSKSRGGGQGKGCPRTALLLKPLVEV